MILAVAGRCPNTVVVIHSVGPVIMESWISHPNVKSVLLASLPGQESGTSLVDVIYGDTTPSGKLPYTIGKSLADYGPHAEIMREPNWEVPQQEFPEGLYVDYRWFDKMEIEPRFEFGYGLSYTNFNFSDLRITKVKSLDDVDDGTTGNSPTKPPVIRNSTIPDRSEVDFPENIRSVSRFVYPYIHPTATIGDSKATPYPYPEGYTTAPHKKSPAGGDQGGDPRLWDVIFKVSVLVANTGSLTGKAVVQLYLTFPEGIEIDVPVRQLRGFDKVELKPGENKVVELELTRRDLSVWNGEVQNWVVPRLKKSEKVGRYTVTIGYSSRKEGVKGRTPQV